MEHKCSLWIAVICTAIQIYGLCWSFPSLFGGQSEVGSENVTAHLCPFLCKLNDKLSCVPPPCPLPPCVDHQKPYPLACCEVCPNGPNCQGPEGHIIKWNHWEIIDGKNCTCTQPLSPATCQ